MIQWADSELCPLFHQSPQVVLPSTLYCHFEVLVQDLVEFLHHISRLKPVALFQDIFYIALDTLDLFVDSVRECSCQWLNQKSTTITVSRSALLNYGIYCTTTAIASLQLKVQDHKWKLRLPEVQDRAPLKISSDGCIKVDSVRMAVLMDADGGRPFGVDPASPQPFRWLVTRPFGFRVDAAGVKEYHVGTCATESVVRSH